MLEYGAIYPTIPGDCLAQDQPCLLAGVTNTYLKNTHTQTKYAHHVARQDTALQVALLHSSTDSVSFTFTSLAMLFVFPFLFPAIISVLYLPLCDFLDPISLKLTFLFSCSIYIPLSFSPAAFFVSSLFEFFYFFF